MNDYGYVIGWATSTIVLLVSPLLVVAIVYLARVNCKLTYIERILSLAFPAESQKSEQDHSRDSDLEKLFVWNRNRKTINNNLKKDEHNDSDKVSHKSSIP
jgi:hypothetical protein